MFDEMIKGVQAETVKYVFNVSLETKAERENKIKITSQSQGDQSKKPQVRKVKKVGRNELCPCGSGLKYKKCCELKEK